MNAKERLKLLLSYIGLVRRFKPHTLKELDSLVSTIETSIKDIIDKNLK